MEIDWAMPGHRLLAVFLLMAISCTSPTLTAEEEFARGNIKMDSQDWQGAIENYSAALEKDSRLFKAYNNRGLALAAMKEYSAAIADYDICLSLCPNLAETYYNRGVVHFRRGQRSEAIIDFTEAIRLSSPYPKAYAARGIVFRVAGDNRSALSDFRKALELSPPGWPDRKSIEVEISALVSEKERR
jgi:tetratricopeptide (TPR) repeat protein